ncbi:sensor histidine kinase [Humidisolicoccus flavus]|uniref:sensor histidine kinase n=1 Tax=Humidisolicoccus flavus TaxID=3111414 RepID=UPI0032473B3A
MPADHARSVQSTWRYTVGSIVFFVVTVHAIVVITFFEWVRLEGGALLSALMVLTAVSAVVQTRFCWFLRVGRGGGLPRIGYVLAILIPALLVWVLGLFSSETGIAPAVPLWSAFTLLALLLPKSQRRLTLAIALLATLGHVLLSSSISGTEFVLIGSPVGFMLALYAAILPPTLLTSLWLWEVIARLDRHQRVAADLAVTQERLRFASDLHDIQGHHLQVISLKAELAERLLEKNPEAARTNIHEVRTLAKQALEETRALVGGYRQVELGDELENAREVLTAAGTTCTLRRDRLPSDPAARSMLALVVREATTNILRHSAATKVSIVLSASSQANVLTITNDASAGAGAPVNPGSVAAQTGGHGLQGLRERLLTIGGSLDVVEDTGAGTFSLRATVPANVAIEPDVNDGDAHIERPNEPAKESK